MVAEWDRATRSMIDGIHLIERINARGASSRCWTSRTWISPRRSVAASSPSYRQWPSEEIVNRSRSCLIVLTNCIGKVYKPRHSRQKRVYQSAEDGPCVEKPG